MFKLRCFALLAVSIAGATGCQTQMGEQLRSPSLEAIEDQFVTARLTDSSAGNDEQNRNFVKETLTDSPPATLKTKAETTSEPVQLNLSGETRGSDLEEQQSAVTGALLAPIELARDTRSAPVPLNRMEVVPQSNRGNLIPLEPLNNEVVPSAFTEKIQDNLSSVQIGAVNSEPAPVRESFSDNVLEPSRDELYGSSESVGQFISPTTSGLNADSLNTPDDAKSYLDMSLEEAIRSGLRNSKVIRDLGGTILRNPSALASAYDPSITHSSPIFGEAAALSEFDAVVNSSAFFERNDRDVNNQFLGTNGAIQQDLGNLLLGVTKRMATGGTASFRSVSDFDDNNSIGNRFGNPSSSWQAFVEGEIRQPLLRGGQVDVNRIAGPGAATGEFNGIEIAKTRTNVSVSEFKLSVRNLVSDIENAYWDLYFAYRDLEAKKAARDNALLSWRRIKALGNAKKVGGEADKEGQAREQYFRFEAEVQDATYGRPGDGTRTNNGTTAGTFRPVSGLRVAERRLRNLVGLPLGDQTIIRPIDEPAVAPSAYDLNACLGVAFETRSELKRQTELIRQAELQMIAAKNTLLPQLDIVGRYRFRGFGRNLIGDSSIENDSAAEDLFGGDHQEWQVGMEVNAPLGYRREHAAIRNIEQRLLREKQILTEQKRQISVDIENAIDNVRRSYLFHALQYNRLVGARDQLEAVKITNKQKKAPLNLVLEAQRRVLDAQTSLYRAKVEFALAERTVEFEKGTLLSSMNIQFSDRENLLESNFCQ